MLADDWETLSDWLNAWIGANDSERERLRARLIADHPGLAAEADALMSVSGRLPGFLETPAAVLAARELAKTERLDPLLPAVSRLQVVRHNRFGQIGVWILPCLLAIDLQRFLVFLPVLLDPLLPAVKHPPAV